jgi:hypothetical protein
MKEPREDRRISSRINQSQTIRIRPAEPNYSEEIRTTLNVSWDGFYFATSIGHYFSGMIVYVTRNFRSNDPRNREEHRFCKSGFFAPVQARRPSILRRAEQDALRHQRAKKKCLQEEVMGEHHNQKRYGA